MTSLALLFVVPLLCPCATGANVALHKVAYQSSKYVFDHIDASAGNAVDGNTNSRLDGNSCTHTITGDVNTWWLVDLLDVYEVTNVTLWNRDIVADRLQNLILEVGSQLPVVLPIPQAERCTAFPGTVGVQVTLTCDAPVIGRFFIVRKVYVPGTIEYLTMCEVAVRGNLIKSDCGPQCLTAEVGKRFMTDNASKFVTVLSPAECASDCHRNIRCLGLNYEMSTGTCEMIYKLKPSVEQLTNAPGWRYYGYNIC
ncbi:fucolectin-like [Haliotis rubra]|uniref:fucolectin-like n=1 Tax=Haliotis rubra TaxID=36100 RepID=UPI001EE5DDAA|nr:fucolectin-like [Haliotis rubra]